MKIGAVTMAFRDEATIRGTLACLNPHVDKHIVLVNEHPYFGDNPPQDRTIDICNEFDKVEVVVGQWAEHDLRNLGNKLCKDCDWVLGFDADEMITAEDMEKLKIVMSKVNKPAIGFRSKVYWGTTDYILHPDPDHIKVCVTRPDVRYWEKQCVSVPYEILERDEHYITHHHLSWCKPKDILQKVCNYAHANEFDGKKWYAEYFENWKFGDKAVQPFGSTWDVKYDPLPEELKCLL
jgi:hypothetical protein